jgi:hypothetical protein
MMGITTTGQYDPLARAIWAFKPLKIGFYIIFRTIQAAEEATIKGKIERLSRVCLVSYGSPRTGRYIFLRLFISRMMPTIHR